MGRAFSLAESMRYILGDFDFVGTYYDNSILYSATREDHFMHLENVFGRFAGYRLKMN